jgi:hypothetical protein
VLAVSCITRSLNSLIYTHPSLLNLQVKSEDDCPSGILPINISIFVADKAKIDK